MPGQNRACYDPDVEGAWGGDRRAEEEAAQAAQVHALELGSDTSRAASRYGAAHIVVQGCQGRRRPRRSGRMGGNPGRRSIRVLADLGACAGVRNTRNGVEAVRLSESPFGARGGARKVPFWGISRHCTRSHPPPWRAVPPARGHGGPTWSSYTLVDRCPSRSTLNHGRWRPGSSWMRGVDGWRRSHPPPPMLP